ncbi:MAG: GNAT family protein [Candidatus Bathyarchaeia archaeon]|jgi:ribosomal-protein-alanine N-acetyltransferase
MWKLVWEWLHGAAFCFASCGEGSARPFWSDLFSRKKGKLSMTIDAAFTHFPSLITNRLHLRQIQPTDAEAFFAIKSDLEVTRRYGQEPHQSIDDTHAWIQRLQASYYRREALFWCLTLKGESSVVGSCTFWNFGAGFHCAEIGYELHRAYWRQGIMAEAISAILTYGFTELGLHRIEANPLAENTASKSLLLKLGFTYEGNLRQRHFFRDHFEDQLYFGMLKEEWLKS